MKTITPKCALSPLLVVIATVSLAACTISAPPPRIQSYTFYLFNALSEDRKLIPLDLSTLNDQPEGQALELGRFWMLSPNGSVIVTTEFTGSAGPNDPRSKPEDVWIIVRDRRTGAERNRFHPPVSGITLAVSEDGSRMALEPLAFSYPQTLDWYVVDTNTGEQAAHVKDTDQPCWRGGVWFDPALRKRAYCIANRTLEGAKSPEPLHIIAYDLASGAKAGELELPDVLAGGWHTGQTRNDQPVEGLLEPAATLSPNGKQMAIVHADADKVTLIDAERFSVERTMSLKRKSSLLDLFAPSVANAKGEMEGTIRFAEFSLDGKHLYVFSQELGENPPTQRGLRVIDLSDGAIIAEALPKYQIQWVQPAPDGSVYVFGTTDKNLGPFEIRPSSPSTLWRLDGLTLKPLAQREFTGYRGNRLVVVSHSTTERLASSKRLMRLLNRTQPGSTRYAGESG